MQCYKSREQLHVTAIRTHYGDLAFVRREGIFFERDTRIIVLCVDVVTRDFRAIIIIKIY